MLTVVVVVVVVVFIQSCDQSRPNSTIVTNTEDCTGKDKGG